MVGHRPSYNMLTTITTTHWFMPVALRGDGLD
jgi:hypothetical protein